MGRQIKHGGTGTKLYVMWLNMKARCKGQSELYRKYYAGIKVCNMWLNNFVAFREWAIKNGWKNGLEIDRKNYTKNYIPSNCRFVTKKVQQSNKRNNVLLKFNGVVKTKRDWAAQIGVPENSLCYRIKQGWPIDKILSSGKQSSNRFTIGKNYNHANNNRRD